MANLQVKQLFLLGKSLGHSFSKDYFNNKFLKEGLQDQWSYENFEVESIEQVKSLFVQDNLVGFNVTIPYKEQIIPYLQHLDLNAKHVGAVNTVVKNHEGNWTGYNTDMPAFAESLTGYQFNKALVLGTGGASKAIIRALQLLKIEYLQIGRKTEINYSSINPHLIQNSQLIVNCTPLGMHPDIHSKPLLPYEFIGENHILYDLVYNPERTLFLEEGRKRGAQVKNGLDMLKLQADMSWELWREV